jgi:hypothetical protein
LQNGSTKSNRKLTHSGMVIQTGHLQRETIIK